MSTKTGIMNILDNYGPKSAYSVTHIGHALNLRDKSGRKWTEASVRSRLKELERAGAVEVVGWEPTGRGFTAKVWGLR